MSRLLEGVLRRVVVNGGFKVTLSSGRTVTIGEPAPGQAPLAVRFTTAATERAILLDPELKLGEAYMDGTLVVEEGSIADLLDLLMAQPAACNSTITVSAKLLFWARMLVRRIAQFNPRRRSRRNVAHHYDLDGRLYSLFLDADRQYSCAYFEYPGQSLDDAQLAKKRHIAAKLMLEQENLRVLDIGSGWGGLGLYLAQTAKAKVTGVTLSKEQLSLARERADEAGLAGQVEFRLQDYRDIPEKFDRIVSVGMFEHVGVAHYGEFFRKVRDLMKDDGVMLLHSIGRADPPGVTNPFIAKYIFPGGYIPALSEVLPHIERAGLVVTDIELLRLHYAETLKAWRERFIARWDEATRLTDERFCRMWEFYLAGSEMGFRHQGLNVFHIQLARKQESVPLTRGYMEPAEERLHAAEARQPSPVRLAGE